MRAANMRLVEHVACRRGLRNQYDIIVTEMGRKPSFCPYRGRWQDNIKIILKEFFFSRPDLSCSVHGLAAVPLNVCNKYSVPRKCKISWRAELEPNSHCGLCHIKLVNGFGVRPIVRETSVNLFSWCCEKLWGINNSGNGSYTFAVV